MSLAIVTVTRNDLAGLRRTLASIDAQTRAPDEHWIIDGASTDGTREFLLSLPPRPGRRSVSEPDTGIYDAMNKGLRQAASDFVWFLNSGDTCADASVVAAICDALTAHPRVDCLYGKIWRRNTHGLRSTGGPVTARDFRVEMPVCHQALVFRRALLADRPYPTRFRFISDWIVTRDLVASGARFQFIDRHLAVYDLSGASSRHRFAIVGEKLRHLSGVQDRARILFLGGGRAMALALAEATGLHSIIGRIRHRKRLSD